MFVELHVLQNFVSSCLNRDDTNSPKDCVFGGHRRARISSQCSKRAVRKHFKISGLLQPEQLAERSRRLLGMVAKLLVERGRPADQATQLAATAFAAIELGVEEDETTKCLLFFGRNEIAGLADVVHQNWDTLAAVKPAKVAEDGDNGDKQKTKKQQKAEAK